MRKVFLITTIIIVAAVLFSDCKKVQEDPSLDKKFIGGERDEHGCLGPAGYT